MSMKFPVVFKDGASVITFTDRDNGTYANGTPCTSSFDDMMVRVVYGKASIVESVPVLTTAEKVARQHKRNQDITAFRAFDVIVNQYIINVKRIRASNMEIRFNDGSYLWVVDTHAARLAGLTDFSYSIKTQEKAV